MPGFYIPPRPKPQPKSTPAAPTPPTTYEAGLPGGSPTGSSQGLYGSQNPLAGGAGAPLSALDAWLAARGLTRQDLIDDPNLYSDFINSFNGNPLGGSGSASAAIAAAVERQRIAEQTRADQANEAIARARLEQERVTALGNNQSAFTSDLMKQGQSPESFYNYLFNRYGEQAPAGQQVQALPLSPGQQPLTLNPQTNQYNAGELAPGVTRLGPIPGITMGQGGASFTLPPYLQNLFQQTGQNVSQLPIGQQAPGYKYASYGTPSVQTWNQYTPSEQGNALGYGASVVGTPSTDETANITRLAPQGSGLSEPTSFARGGLMMPQPSPQGGVPGMGLMPPMPQGGVATQPTMGAAPNQRFGEAGPEAAVPLNSPGGPMAMQALQQNQQAGMQPNMGQPAPPPLPLAPTSRETGMYATQPLLPLADVPNTTLGPGQRGEAVVRLQRALEQAGLLQLPQGVSYGYYGPLTTQAVAQFQQQTGHQGQPGLWDGSAAMRLKSMLMGPQGPQGPSPFTQRPQL